MTGRLETILLSRIVYAARLSCFAASTLRDLMRPRSGSTCHHMPTPCLNPRGALVTPSHRRSRARHLAYRSTALSRSRLNRRGHCATSFRSHTLTRQSSLENAHSSACRAVVIPLPGLTDHSSHTDVLTQSFHCDILLQSTDHGSVGTSAHHTDPGCSVFEV